MLDSVLVCWIVPEPGRSMFGFDACYSHTFDEQKILKFRSFDERWMGWASIYWFISHAPTRSQTLNDVK